MMTVQVVHGLAVLVAIFATAFANDVATFTVTDTVLSPRPIPSDFVSFSLEVLQAPGDLVMPSGQYRQSLINLMQNLRNDRQGTNMQGYRGPNLRIGGASTDKSVYSTDPNVVLPSGVTYRISDADLNTYKVPQVWNGTITMGLNFRDPANNMGFVMAHVKAMSNMFGFSNGYIDGLEIGNEVDFYRSDGIRAPDYTIWDYISESKGVVAAIEAVVPMPMIQGGTFCCMDRTNFNTTNAGIYIQQFAAAHVLKSYSYHRYPLAVCNGGDPSINDLMDDRSSEGQLGLYAYDVRFALSSSSRFFIGEGNTVACTGKDGVSNVMASALWAIDFSFNNAKIGVTRFNVHSSGNSAYSVFYYADPTLDQITVNPIYYGLWMFNMATSGPNTQVTQVNIVSTTNPLVKAWATLNSLGQRRLVFVHKDSNATAPCDIQFTIANGKSGAAQVVRLLAQAGMTNKRNGITMAGTTMFNALDGNPIGNWSPETISPVSVNGAQITYKLNLPFASAAMVVLPH